MLPTDTLGEPAEEAPELDPHQQAVSAYYMSASKLGEEELHAAKEELKQVQPERDYANPNPNLINLSFGRRGRVLRR